MRPLSKLVGLRKRWFGKFLLEQTIRKDPSLWAMVRKSYPLDFPVRLRDDPSALSKTITVLGRHWPRRALRGLASFPALIALMSATGRNRPWTNKSAGRSTSQNLIHYSKIPTFEILDDHLEQLLALEVEDHHLVYCEAMVVELGQKLSRHGVTVVWLQCCAIQL